MTGRSYDTVEGIIAALATYSTFCNIIEQRYAALDAGETLCEFVVLGGQALMSKSGDVFFADEFKSEEGTGQAAMTREQYEAAVRYPGSKMRRDRIWLLASDMPTPIDRCIDCGDVWTIQQICDGYELELIAQKCNDEDVDHIVYCHKGACAERRAVQLDVEHLARFMNNIHGRLTCSGFDDVQLESVPLPQNVSVVLLDNSSNSSTPPQEKAVYIRAKTRQGTFGIFLHDCLALDLHGTQFTVETLLGNPVSYEDMPFGKYILPLHGNQGALNKLCVLFLKRSIIELTMYLDMLTTPMSRTLDESLPAVLTNDSMSPAGNAAD